MSAVLGRPVLALHLLSANLKLKRHSLGARHVHPIRNAPIRLLCSLDNNATKAAPNNDLGASGKHLDLTDQVYNYILRHTREPQVLFST